MTETPPKDYYDYTKLIGKAFKSVMIDVLKRCAIEGILGEHHFYITFETHHEGVSIPEELKQAYPLEMTIILQHEFFDLIAEDDYFAVTLHFNKTPARLTIAYDAIIAFFDPHIDIRLFLKPQIALSEEGDNLKTEASKITQLEVKNNQNNPPKNDGGGDDSNQKIISLDQFRNKKDDTEQ